MRTIKTSEIKKIVQEEEYIAIINTTAANWSIGNILLDINRMVEGGDDLRMWDDFDNEIVIRFHRNSVLNCAGKEIDPYTESLTADEVNECLIKGDEELRDLDRKQLSLLFNTWCLITCNICAHFNRLTCPTDRNRHGDCRHFKSIFTGDEKEKENENE